jgi:hypothetical protein
MIPSESNKQREMPVAGEVRLEYGNGHLDLTRDVLVLGKYLGDDEIVRVLLCGVALPVEQWGDEIRY